ncbi:MAG TPA: BTAD domain-containing putative transcriptional regulator [Marmoricola sp.]|nr:BTAD domain-containing putative transcriptional regulator [Marmoricola sp.]
MGIGVLGTLTVDEASASLGRRDRVVLSALSARAGQVVSQDALIDALWRDEPPASAQKVLHGCVSRLRRVLGSDAIQTAPPGYRLAVAEDAVDSLRFERTVSRARDLAAMGQFDRAGHMVGEALELWRGRPFPDVDDWEPAVVEGMRLEEVRQEAQELRIDCYLRSGRHHEVLADAAALLREAPAREARWALLARAQYQDGRQAEALATLQQARELLDDRLGIDPGPELDRLQEAVLRQDPQLLPDAAAPATGAEVCPYRGLAAYDVADSETFFGRDREVATCLALLQARGVLAVVGPSGSGKSSVVRAGVAATLSRAGTRVHVMTPGEAPVRVLDNLPRRSARDAWVVDQCEEVFTLCSDTDQRSEFLDRLVAHAEQAPLAIALRADRLAELAPYPAFTRLVERGLHLLAAMGEAALREVVEAPARQAGLFLEPGLVDLLVREVEGEPGALPLLSHALQETWQRREGNTLTVAGYQAAGGIRGAVAQTAEAVYGRVDPGLQHLMRELMLRLVSTGTAGEPSRIRAPRTRVIVEPAQERLVDDLVAARLLTSEEGAIEIAHESLARAWPRLRDWLADDVEGQRILHHVTAAADAWDALGRPDSELYRGTRLQQALEWRDQVSVELTGLENEFLDAGRLVAEGEEQDLAERARQQARMIRRQRVALVAGSVFLVLALAASGMALRAGERARAGEGAAEASALAANAGRIGAQSLTVEDAALSVLLATEAMELDDTAQTRSYLREAMARRTGLVASTEQPDRWMTNLSVDPRGGAAVGYSADNQVHRFDLESGEITASYDGDGPGTRHTLFIPGALAYSPGGAVVAVGSQPVATPSLVLLDSETMEPVPDQPSALTSRPAMGLSVAFSANGRWLAGSFLHVEGEGSAAEPTRAFAQVWDLDDLDAAPRVVELPSPGGAWQRVQVSDDGSTLYSGAPPAAYPVPDRPGEQRPPLWRRDDLESYFGFLTDLSPDGRWLAAPVVEPAGTTALVVLDTRDGGEVARFAGFGPGVFSTDGTMLAAGALDGYKVTTWRWRTGDVVRRFNGLVPPIEFSADGSMLHNAGFHGIESWDLDGDRQFMAFTPSPQTPGDRYALSQRGDLVATYGEGSGNDTDTVSLLRTDGSEPLRQFRIGGIGDWYWGDWNPDDWRPDASAFVVGRPDGTVVTLPLKAKARTLDVSREGITDLVHSDDGQHLVVADESRTVRRIDADTGSPAGKVVRLAGVAAAVTVAADGRHAFVLVQRASDGPYETGRVETWSWVDLVDGRIDRTGALPDPGDLWWWSADLDPSDPGRAAVFGTDGVLVLDLATGRPVRSPVAVHDGGTKYGGYTDDGSRIVAGGEDGRVSLWDGEDGRLLDIATVDPGAIVAPTMLPDGVTMLATNGKGFYRWDTRIGPALEAACRAAGRSMTEVEWRTHVGEDVPYRATCG